MRGLKVAMVEHGADDLTVPAARAKRKGFGILGSLPVPEIASLRLFLRLSKDQTDTPSLCLRVIARCAKGSLTAGSSQNAGLSLVPALYQTGSE